MSGMRRRLTIAIVVLVAATIAVTTIGSYYFIRRAAISTAQQELNRQGRAVSRTITDGPPPTGVGFTRELRVIRRAGAFAGIRVVALHPNGTITGTLPAGLTAQALAPARLLAGEQASGRPSHLVVFTAVPTPIRGITAYTPVLVITRKVHLPGEGVRYFALVGAVALVAAAVMALLLARRFTRPLFAAVATTQRIAAGDLDTPMPAAPRGYPEFAQLEESINAMGTNLARARDQERQFLLSVSHELRTPLTSIRGYADAVIDGATDDPVAAAEVISSEARRLERLVQDLLDLARLDADRFSLRLRMVDCVEIAKRVVEGFRPRARQLGLELDMAAPAPDLPLLVHADADRLGQILANLVENAASFADHRILVGVGTVETTDRADTVPTRTAVWVIDDGPGIPADELAKIFDRHFTSDRVGGRRRGAGLGLAIVAELAGAMGADVRAESPVDNGRGTRMVVWFVPPDGSQPHAGSVA